MTRTEALKREVNRPVSGSYAPYYFKFLGYQREMDASNVLARGNGVKSLFSQTRAYVYENDLIAGSIRPLWCEKSEEELAYASKIVKSYGERGFSTNSDHFAPDYRRVLKGGLPGLLEEIEASRKRHAGEEEKLQMLRAMKCTLLGFRAMILHYAEAAEERKRQIADPQQSSTLSLVAENCRYIADHKPETFSQALQLVWLCHIAFQYEERYAMALGRMDQYLAPFYQRDLQNGSLDREQCVELLENVFIKIFEHRSLLDGDDVVNICIGGTGLDGSWAGNELSLCILQAVKNCNIPGPNLSARISSQTPDSFLDACLQVIGTGLGYPALMNDEVNIPALLRMGYDKKDAYNHCFVGCIENFIPGMQPPWSDGRFDTPRFLEYVFYNGRGVLHPSLGIQTKALSEIGSMEEFMSCLEEQLAYGAKEYMLLFRNKNAALNPANYCQPFLSCFCRDCIGRALDMGMGGSVYPSAHGVALMGVGTLADSLAAIEKLVFVDKECSLRELAEAMKADFVGYEALHRKLLASPKYGNNDDFVDRYAVWFVQHLTSLFDPYRTPDGGRITCAMAANISNIHAGRHIGATPDGRKAGQPLSDAASPTYGRDQRGATATLHSVTNPDYSKIACGTVINQKFSPSLFSEGKRQKLLSLVKTYFRLGGQELQVNATSRELLLDAMEHPDRYPNLVVRVSGFSALYVTLDKEVQLDILNRTQQE